MMRLRMSLLCHKVQYRARLVPLPACLASLPSARQSLPAPERSFGSPGMATVFLDGTSTDAVGEDTKHKISCLAEKSKHWQGNQTGP